MKIKKELTLGDLILIPVLAIWFLFDIYKFVIGG